MSAALPLLERASRSRRQVALISCAREAALSATLRPLSSIPNYVAPKSSLPHLYQERKPLTPASIAHNRRQRYGSSAVSPLLLLDDEDEPPRSSTASFPTVPSPTMATPTVTPTSSIPESSIVSATVSTTANSNPSSPVVETITVTRSSRIVGAAIIIGAAILVLCLALILMKVRTLKPFSNQSLRAFSLGLPTRALSTFLGANSIS
jgi:hypothetical protein